MSHASGTVYNTSSTPNEKNIIAYFEYDGYIALPKLYSTRKDLGDNWRKSPESSCVCKKTPEQVILRADYGNGIEWYASACLTCMHITSNLDPYSQYYEHEDYWR